MFGLGDAAPYASSRRSLLRSSALVKHRGMDNLFQKSSRSSRSIGWSVLLTAAVFVLSFVLVMTFKPSDSTISSPGPATSVKVYGFELGDSKISTSNDSTGVGLNGNRTPHYERGILMSCPFGQSHTHQGNWKPRSMIKGVEAVMKQLDSFGTRMPLYFGYYEEEKSHAEPWCESMVARHRAPVHLICFKIPEKFPANLYGYAKIFAMKHVPLTEVLWIDCDVFPIKALEPLFEDSEFQKTGSTFWPDSRDFFDESLLSPLLARQLKKKYPLNAWWVRQGFDSGLVLLNREKCAPEIEAVCQVARSGALSPQVQALRNMSMGDKDVFHVVWILHDKPFTMIPYTGESGNIQTKFSYERSMRSRRRKLRPRGIGWHMSSQLKYGRDGDIYALHQLHRQHPFALIATLSSGDVFHTPKMTRSKPFVMPMLVARKDLRAMRTDSVSSADGLSTDFVKDVESVLIREGKAASRRPQDAEGSPLRQPRGVVIRRGSDVLLRAADEMNAMWRVRPAAKRYRASTPNETGGIRIREGQYSKKIYSRLRHSLEEQKVAREREKRNSDAWRLPQRAK